MACSANLSKDDVLNNVGVKKSNLRKKRKSYSNVVEHTKVISGKITEYKIDGIGIKSYVQMFKYLISSFNTLICKSLAGRVLADINMHSILASTLDTVSQFFDSKKDMMLNYLLTSYRNYTLLLQNEIVIFLKTFTNNYVDGIPTKSTASSQMYGYDKNTKPPSITTSNLKKDHQFVLLNALIVLSSLLGILEGTIHVNVLRNVVEALAIESRITMDLAFFDAYGQNSVL